MIREAMRRHGANMLTAGRLLGSVWLLFLPVFSVAFYIVYLLCGLSDMIDGTVARMTNSASEWGARIDTVADLAFLTASMIRLLPAMQIPIRAWIWGAIIAVIKIGNLILGYVHAKQLLALHTILNKLTGLIMFLWPLTMPWVDVTYSAFVVCAIATVSAVHEGICIGAMRKNK